jgi:hypothetical protein
MSYQQRYTPIKHRIFFPAIIISISLIISLFCLSCQIESSEIQWSADGVIGDDEYTDTATYGGGLYNLYWATDDNYIYMGIKAKTSGFVAVGFGSGMTQTDVIFGYVKDGEAYIYDVYVTSYSGPHPEDTDLGGSNDILDYGASEEDGYTVIEFKRKLDTGDDYDSVITKGESHNIVWSYGGSDGMMSIHSQRGYGKIEP